MFDNRNSDNLYTSFVVRVLAPPFVALMVLCVVGLWQLDRILDKQAVDSLRASARTSAATLEREFDLRETVLKQTGTELFIIKSEYAVNRKVLDSNRDACRSYIQQKRTYVGAPGGVCQQFMGAFAGNSSNLAALEDEYVKLGQQLIQSQDERINERLTAYKQFFPETLGLMVVDTQERLVSSGLSGVFKDSVPSLQTDAVVALNVPIRGKLETVGEYQLAVFAFPISGGSVLAAYDMHNEQFLRQTWATAPIDRTRTLAVILDSNSMPVYPSLKDGSRFRQQRATLSQEAMTILPLDGVNHTIIASTAGKSGWQVAIASPTAAVQALSRDALIAGIVFIGLFMIGFLWVGTYFIRRTLRNIVSLVSGAIIFGSGRLDYRISLDNADGEFMRLANTMNSMADRLAAAEKAIDEKNKEFISIATHELRAPLTSIIGYVSLLQDGYQDKFDSGGKVLLDQVYYGTARLRDQVNDMLNVARLESGRNEFVLAPVAIKDIIAGVMGTMSVVAKMASVTLTYRNTNAADVVADEQHLRIIINNFVSNAIKYNRKDGSVWISHVVKEGQLVTAVADDGLGIPEDQKAKMFEKFFRVKGDDRKNVTGTGLGMYIVKQYIEQMHGRLWFESTHGKGTTFYFSLPLAPKQNLGTKLKHAVKTSLPNAKPAKKKQKDTKAHTKT